MKKLILLILTIAVFPVKGQIPSNDDCSNATLITSVPFNENLDATNATNNNGGLDVCGSPAWGMNDGVWYTLTGNGGDVNFQVTPTGWNCQVDVYSGSCGNFTCIMGVNDGITDEMEQGTFYAEQGIQYFINIGHWAYDPNNPQADNPEGPFTIYVDGAVLKYSNQQIPGLTVKFDPTRSTLFINNNEDIKRVKIFNLSGQEIFKKNYQEQNIKIPFYNFTKGIYILTIQTEHQTGTYKFFN